MELSASDAVSWRIKAARDLPRAMSTLSRTSLWIFMGCGCKPARDMASESAVTVHSDTALFFLRRRQAR
jgi:hypothetical protein